MEENVLNAFLLFTFAFANLQTTDSKSYFYDSIEELNSVTVKNLKMINFDKKRKYNHTQSCIENETIETSLNKSFDDVFAHIDVKIDIGKNTSNFACFTDNVKTIDYDVNLI